MKSLVSKGARITRPKIKIEGIDCIIKNDQFFKTIDKAVEDNNPLMMARIVGSDTLEGVARQIARLHNPIQFNWAAKFGLPATAPVQSARAPLPATPPIQQAAQPKPTASALIKAAEPDKATAAEEADKKTKQKLVCHSCSEPVAYNVAKFCWFNKPKFGGNIFCMNCQKKV